MVGINFRTFSILVSNRILKCKMIFGIFLVSLITFYLIFFYRKWKFIKFSWNAKGFFLPILPIVGQTYIGLLTGTKFNLCWLLEFCYKYVGFPVSFWLGHTYNYVSNDPDEAKIILNHPKSFEKSTIYSHLKYIFAGSIIIAPYELWKPHRRHFSRSLKPLMLKTFTPTYYRRSLQLTKELNSLPKNESLFDFFTKYSFTAFCLTNLGLDEDKMPSNMGRVGIILREVQDLFKSIILNPIIAPDNWLKLSSNGQKAYKLFEELKMFTKSIIEEKRKQHQDLHVFLENNQNVSLMDLMLTVDKNMMSDEEIFGEFNLFSSAATDTTGGTLAFCSVLLGMHPEIQENLYKEIVEVLGEHEITHEDVPKLKYTEAVLQETLRLFPAIPFISRQCNEDIDLGTKTIPKGSDFVISIFHIHRDPKNWPDPLKFDPTRFLPENHSKIKPYTFMPFAAGQRDCIGKMQAMLLLKMTMANVIRTFKITSKHKSVEEFHLESSFTMTAINHMDCHFAPRDSSFINNNLSFKNE